MNKKIIASLATIAIVAAAAIGGTIAYFSSQQVSKGNIIKAGTIDLQINHTAQTYNGVDCKTCKVEFVSDTSNMVVAKNGAAITAYPAFLVTQTHSNWSASINGASWIWATDPTTSPDDTQNDVTYTFRKEFQWMGPATGAKLDLGVAADNSYEVKLNGVQKTFDNGEYNFTAGGQDSISLTLSASDLNQGTNALEITVKNWAQTNGTPQTNPAGLLYKLTIDGNCGDSWFKNHCQLWGTGAFDNQKFFNFDDVKPGDWGTNKISLTVTSNDAHVCMYVPVYGPAEGSDENAAGALAGYIKFNVKYNGSLIGKNISLAGLKKYLGTLQASETKYIDLEWCFGTFVEDNDGWTCDGTGNHNDAQGGQLVADLGFFAEQTRHNNNGEYQCPEYMPGYEPK